MHGRDYTHSPLWCLEYFSIIIYTFSLPMLKIPILPVSPIILQIKYYTFMYNYCYCYYIVMIMNRIHFSVRKHYNQLKYCKYMQTCAQKVHAGFSPRKLIRLNKHYY